MSACIDVSALQHVAGRLFRASHHQQTLNRFICDLVGFPYIGEVAPDRICSSPCVHVSHFYCDATTTSLIKSSVSLKSNNPCQQTFSCAPQVPSVNKCWFNKARSRSLTLQTQTSKREKAAPRSTHVRPSRSAAFCTRRVCLLNSSTSNSGPEASSGVLSGRRRMKRGKRRLTPRSACRWPAAACVGMQFSNQIAPRHARPSLRCFDGLPFVVGDIVQACVRI